VTPHDPDAESTIPDALDVISDTTPLDELVTEVPGIVEAQPLRRAAAAPEDEATPDEPVDEPVEEVPAGRRRRGARRPAGAAPVFQPPVAEPVTAAAPPPLAAPVGAVAFAFTPPAAAAPTAADDPLPQVETEERLDDQAQSAPDEPDELTDDPAGTQPGATAAADDRQDGGNQDDDEGDGSSARRRRRGRRGRGRSRDDAADGAEGTGVTPTGTGADRAGEDSAGADRAGEDSPVEDGAGLLPALAAPAGEPGAAPDDDAAPRSPRGGRRRSGRGAQTPTSDDAAGASVDAGSDVTDDEDDEDDEGGASGSSSRRRRRRRRRGGGGEGAEEVAADDPPSTVVHVRSTRSRSGGGGGGSAADADGVRGVAGSTRLEAKRQRRRDGRGDGTKRRTVITEAEYLARRESVDRTMVVRRTGDRTQIAMLEDSVLVEHYVTRGSATSYAGNIYLGRVQNVLPSMEAAFVDIGKGRNAVLYAGEVSYDASSAGGRGAPRIEQALKSGQSVLVQVTKDPVGHKGARLTAQISLPGRFLVYIPQGPMTGISRKLPDNERSRLKAILKKVVPEDAGVIIRTAAEGASEEEITRDVERLQALWQEITAKAAKASPPSLVHGEPDLVVRVVRDIFNEDITSLVVQGDRSTGDDGVAAEIEEYVGGVAPDLLPRVTRWAESRDVFAAHRVDEQLRKALERKVGLPSGGSLVIDRTEALTAIDVNTGRFTGAGGNLEETVTRNNLEAAEEVARQLRLRDIGGMVIIDFIDMVLESNRELVLRRLVECLSRDRTKHQVSEVTSLGLVQLTRKRVGQGLLEAFSDPCPECGGRGVLLHLDEHMSGLSVGTAAAPPAPRAPSPAAVAAAIASASRASVGGDADGVVEDVDAPVEPPVVEAVEPSAVEAAAPKRGRRGSRRPAAEPGAAAPEPAAVAAVAGLTARVEPTEAPEALEALEAAAPDGGPRDAAEPVTVEDPLSEPAAEEQAPVPSVEDRDAAAPAEPPPVVAARPRRRRVTLPAATAVE